MNLNDVTVISSQRSSTAKLPAWLTHHVKARCYF